MGRNKGSKNKTKMGEFLKCFTCEKIYYVKKSRQGKSRFCSASCRGKVILNTPVANKKKSQPGDRNPNWKGGKIRNGKYLAIYLPKSLMADGKGYILEHRLVMARHLKRDLSRKEIVHHINGNPTDNRVENLQLVDRAEHMKIHHHR